MSFIPLLTAFPWAPLRCDEAFLIAFGRHSSNAVGCGTSRCRPDRCRSPHPHEGAGGWGIPPRLCALSGRARGGCRGAGGGGAPQGSSSGRWGAHLKNASEYPVALRPVSCGAACSRHAFEGLVTPQTRSLGAETSRSWVCPGPLTCGSPPAIKWASPPHSPRRRSSAQFLEPPTLVHGISE